MIRTKVNDFIIVILTAICLLSINSGVDAQVKETSTDEKLLQILLNGNTRYISGDYSKKNFVNERAELVKGQQPYAIILSCSDSRVPPELIFDESLGRLFIIRVAGNVVDSVTLGSIEYAVEHLHVKLLVVMGHESCGAVKAALEGGELTPNIDQIIRRIEPAVHQGEINKIDKTSLLEYTVEENVKNQIAACLNNSEVIREYIEKKELQITGAVYMLKTGMVELLPVSVPDEAH